MKSRKMLCEINNKNICYRSLQHNKEEKNILLG